MIFLYFLVERKYLGEHLDEYNSQQEYEVWRDSMTKSGSQLTFNTERSAQNPMCRRTLRQRKIHSVKRQIQIKEKMLEVFLFIRIILIEKTKYNMLTPLSMKIKYLLCIGTIAERVRYVPRNCSC